MPRKETEMWTRSAYLKVAIALAVTSVTLFTTPVFGQTPASSPGSNVSQAEFEVMREQLLKMEEQQKALLDQFARMQEGGASQSGQPANMKTQRYQDGMVI